MSERPRPKSNRRHRWTRLTYGIYVNGYGETIYDGYNVTAPGSRFEKRLWETPGDLHAECIRLRNTAMRLLERRTDATSANVQANVIAQRVFAKRGGKGNLWEAGPPKELVK